MELIDVSTTIIGAIALIVALAGFVQLGIGMGFGLTASPLLALIDPALVPGPVLVLSLFTASWGAWAERGGIAWSEVGTGAIGRVAGVCLALVVLTAIPGERGFMLAFGLLVGLAVILSFGGFRIAFTRPNLISVSALSGLMATITSVGAPPLALIYQDRPAADARPTLAAFFAVGCVAALAGLWLAGRLGSHDAVLAALMSPPMLIGAVLGRRLRGRFDARFRLALLAITGAAALLLIQRGLS